MGLAVSDQARLAAAIDELSRRRARDDQIRLRAAEAERRRRLGPSASLHPAQRSAIDDSSRLRAWQCDRRAGKTTAAMVEFYEDGRSHPGSEYAYIALTRTSAERICWRIIESMDREYRLGWDLNQNKMRIRQPNRSSLTLYGADSSAWIDRLYGQYFRRVWIDEAAFFKIDTRRVREGEGSTGMRYLVYDILEPTIADQRGSITLMSRPGIVPSGLFYDVCTGKEPGWSLRKWSWRDNPYIKDQVAEMLREKISHNPEIKHDPSYRRNWCNEWVDSSGDRVYGSYSPDRNGVCDWAPSGGERYVLGLDLGWHDRTAFSLIAWTDRGGGVVEVDSYAQQYMLLDQIAARCRQYMQDYPGLSIVGDPSRAQAFEELRKRYDLPIIPAEKSHKTTWISIVDNDYASGSIKIVDPRRSVHHDEMMTLVWDRRPNGEIRERAGVKNDACDAFLYAYRHSYHYFSAPEPKPTVSVGSKEWYDKIEAEYEAQVDRDQEEAR